MGYSKDHEERMLEWEGKEGEIMPIMMMVVAVTMT